MIQYSFLVRNLKPELSFCTMSFFISGQSLSRGDVDRRGSTSEPMDICFGRLQATSEERDLDKSKIARYKRGIDKGVDKGSKLGNYGAGLSI